MKQLIFVNENFKLNKSELEKFIYLLDLFSIKEEHLPLLEKEVIKDELLFILDQKFVTFKEDLIIYNNYFTKDNIIISFINRKIYLSNYQNDDKLKYLFYRLSDNYLIIDC